MRFFGLLLAIVSVLQAQQNQGWSDLFEEEATGFGSERSQKKTEAFVYSIEKWENHLALRFLFAYRYTNYPKYTSSMIFPFWYSLHSKIDERRKRQILLWYSEQTKQRSMFTLFPIFYFRKHTIADAQQTAYSVPLFFNLKTMQSLGDRSQFYSFWLFPLFVNARREFAVFPLFSLKRSSNGKAYHFSPIHFYRSEPGLYQFWLLPWADFQYGAIAFRALLPAFADWKGVHTRWLLTPAFFQYHNQRTRESLFLTPLIAALWTEKGEGVSSGGDNFQYADYRFSWIYSAFSITKRFSEFIPSRSKMETTETTIDSRDDSFVSHRKNSQDYFRTDLLFSVFVYEKADQLIHQRALPLYWLTIDRQNELEQNGIFPVYYSHKEKGKEYFISLPYAKQVTPLHKMESYALWAYWRNENFSDKTIRMDWFYPIARYSQNPQQKSWYIFPIWYGRSSAQENVFFTPVFASFQKDFSDENAGFFRKANTFWLMGYFSLHDSSSYSANRGDTQKTSTDYTNYFLIYDHGRKKEWNGSKEFLLRQSHGLAARSLYFERRGKNNLFLAGYGALFAETDSNSWYAGAGWFTFLHYAHSNGDYWNHIFPLYFLGRENSPHIQEKEKWDHFFFSPVLLTWYNENGQNYYWNTLGLWYDSYNHAANTHDRGILFGLLYRESNRELRSFNRKSILYGFLWYHETERETSWQHTSFLNGLYSITQTGGNATTRIMGFPL